MQTIDFRFEILFLAAVLFSVIGLIAALTLAVKSRWPVAKKLLIVLTISWVAYLSIVAIVAANTPQRILPMNTDLCFDEMCFAVVNVQTVTNLPQNVHPSKPDDTFCIVTIRVSSRARVRPQREQGLRASLWSQGHFFRTSADGQRAWQAAHPETSLDVDAQVSARENFLSDQVFEIPKSAVNLGLVLDNGFTPGYLIIGECPLFHKPTMFQLIQ
jgi:hypothetical protein